MVMRFLTKPRSWHGSCFMSSYYRIGQFGPLRRGVTTGFLLSRRFAGGGSTKTH